MIETFHRVFTGIFSSTVLIGIGVGLVSYVIGLIFVDAAAWLRELNRMSQFAVEAIAAHVGKRWLPGKRLWQFGYWLDKMSSRFLILDAKTEAERQCALWKVSQDLDRGNAVLLDKVLSSEVVPTDSKKVAHAAKTEHAKLVRAAAATGEVLEKLPE